MNEHQMLGYFPGTTIIHRLNGTAKLFFLLVFSIACMTTYDTRFLALIAFLSLFLLKIAAIRWSQISFVVKFIVFFSILNLLAIYLFSPEYGVQLYGTKTVLFAGIGRYSITSEQLFYEVNLALKYLATVPLTLVFLFTTNPSEFASSLNRLGLNYKICYAVALAIRYIPDVQEEYLNISLTQQARGIELSKKGQLLQRLRNMAGIIVPLIFSSLDRIETISTAMELRRFGEKKKRTWYAQRPFSSMDIWVMILAVLLISLSFYLFKVNHGRFYNPF